MRRRELQPLLEPVVERLAGHPAISAVVVVGSHSSGLSGPNSDIDLFVYTRAPHEELHGLRHSLASALADPSTLRIVGQAGHPNTDVWALPHTGTWLDIMFWQTAWADAELDRRLVHHIAQPGYTTAFWRSIRDAMPLFERDEWHPSLQNRAQTPYPAGLRDRILSLNTALLGSTNPFSFRNQLAGAVEREDTLAAHGAAAKCLASYFDLIFAANRILHPGEKRLIEIAVTECSNLPTDFESNVMSVTRAPTTRQTVLRVDQMLEPRPGPAHRMSRPLRTESTAEPSRRRSHRFHRRVTRQGSVSHAPSHHPSCSRPQGPAGASEMSSINGQLVTETLDYDGGRHVTVYVPPGPTKAVVFTADGGWHIARLSEALEAAEVPPTMIVGVHGLPDDDRRLKEYVPGFDPERFAAHERFFVDDVRGRVQSRFGVALPADRTAVWGASLGGELSLAMGIRHPDIFGAVFSASPGAGYKPPTAMPPSLPRFYLVAGIQEPFFLENATRWAAALHDAGADVVMMQRDGGHGGAFWGEEFPLMVAWAFGR